MGRHAVPSPPLAAGGVTVPASTTLSIPAGTPIYRPPLSETQRRAIAGVEIAREILRAEREARHAIGRVLVAMRADDSWDSLDHPAVPDEHLPPDYTCGDTHGYGQCGALWTAKGCMVCTRIHGHTGRHAAGNLVHVVAVWGEDR